MAITLNGTTGITTPDLTSEAGLTVDGVSFASGAPANTLVTTSGGNVGVGTSSPSQKLEVAGNMYINTSGNPYLQIKTSGAGNNPYIRMQADTNYWNIQSTFSNTNDDLLFQYNGTERMRLDSIGRLLVNNTNLTNGYIAVRQGTYYGIQSDTTNAGGGVGHVVFTVNGATVGTITTSGTTTSYNTSSDYRLKEDWVAVADASTRVNALKPVNFAWKADGKRVDGFLAHELAEVVPEAVTGEKDAVDAKGNPEYQGIDQSKLVPLLTAALQEALGKIETLEARVAALEAA